MFFEIVARGGWDRIEGLLVVPNGEILVLTSTQLFLCSKEKERLLRDWKTPEDQKLVLYGSFCGIIRDSNGDILVLESPSGTIFRISLEDGICSRFRGPFSYPNGFVLGKDGNIYITDGPNSTRIHRMRTDRRTCNTLVPRSDLDWPCSVCNSMDGDLFVVDEVSGRSNIMKVNMEGKVEKLAELDWFAHGIVADGYGNILVTKRESGAVCKINLRDGSRMDLDLKGKEGSIVRPMALVCEEDGIYVGCSGTVVRIPFIRRWNPSTFGLLSDELRQSIRTVLLTSKRGGNEAHRLPKEILYLVFDWMIFFAPIYW